MSTPGLASARHAGRAHVLFRDVSKSYDGKAYAVDELNLEIQHGEFLTLLGPSGSGKTSVLMMLAGFESVTRGEIEIDGKRIDRIAANKRGLGMVFQNYALFPHMSVSENLAFPLKVRRKSAAEIEERVSALLDMVQLTGFGSRRPSQLSGGQQQRVAVARALIFNPTLVLMDEPLGALDKQLREQMQFEIKSIHDRLGLTFVYVTHDQTEALTMSDRIAVFRNGTIQQLSTPNDLYDRPQTRFVANFIGENNQITGTVEAVDAEGMVEVSFGNGDRLRAPARVRLRPGMAVAVSIRPERVRLLGPDEHADDELAVRVTERVFVGDHVRLVLSAPGVEPIVAKLTHGSAGHAVALGEDVRIGWQSTDCLALDAREQ